MEHITLLQHLHHGIRCGIRRHDADRLMAMRVEFLADRMDFGEVEFFETV